MAIKVHEANIHDSKGAKPTIENLAYKFPRLSKILLMEVIKVIWLHGEKTSLVGNWKWFSDQKKAPKNSMSFLNDGLWKELFLGLRTIGDSPLIMSF